MTKKVLNPGKQTKSALTDDEMMDILYEAKKMSRDRGLEEYKICMIFCWTGMHVKVMQYPNLYNPHTEYEDGIEYIVWNRTKKVGEKARTEVPVSPDIDFDVDAWFDELRKRRASSCPRRISRDYFYKVCKRVGIAAGIHETVSPMTFRHTLGVWMGNQGYPESTIIDVLNCTRETAKTYLKRSRKTRTPLFERYGWKR